MELKGLPLAGQNALKCTDLNVKSRTFCVGNIPNSPFWVLAIVPHLRPHTTRHSKTSGFASACFTLSYRVSYRSPVLQCWVDFCGRRRPLTPGSSRGLASTDRDSRRERRSTAGHTRPTSVLCSQNKRSMSDIECWKPPNSPVANTNMINE